jgi:hypothetical protein
MIRAMIRIERTGVIAPEIDEIDELRQQFAQRHSFVLPEFIEPGLHVEILRQLETGQFYGMTHHGPGQREFASDLTLRESNLALHLIHLLLNDPAVFRILHEITDCGPFAGFAGRIYRNLPAADHHLEWHDDTDSNERLLGFSLSLGPERCSGGIFQLRERQSKRIIREVCSNPRDAHIFRISRELQHRVTPVVGDVPRTAASGWFLSRAGYLTNIKTLSSGHKGRVPNDKMVGAN